MPPVTRQVLVDVEYLRQGCDDFCTNKTLSLNIRQVFLESLVDRYHHPLGKIKFRYTMVTEDAVTEGNQIMARWSMETLNARQCGARIELHQQGMLLSKFSSVHKIVSLDIMVSKAYEFFVSLTRLILIQHPTCNVWLSLVRCHGVHASSQNGYGV